LVLTADFDFDLPRELIAQQPVEPRDRARLMVIDRARASWSHRTFAELPELLRPGDVLVRNNTRVLPARLLGRRTATGGKWEALFLRELADGRWEMLATTRGRPAEREMVVVGQGLELMIEGRGSQGTWIVRPLNPEHTAASAFALLERHGQVPLPPYIRRADESARDREAYQTIYSARPGSIAAPTAGLHFTDELFTRLADHRIDWVDLTLHVGVGTFRPIQVERLEDHVMHAEWIEISAPAVQLLESRRRSGGRIVAVGTTSARTLETAASSGHLRPHCGETELFIRPGHHFRGLDALVTNFHLPRSSLLVLVGALLGHDLVHAVYREAIRERYRFFSYGDAMLIQ
jgi:S-adenosylmethionine:tRNA ribosyltransferase-isomerase